MSRSAVLILLVLAVAAAPAAARSVAPRADVICHAFDEWTARIDHPGSPAGLRLGARLADEEARALAALAAPRRERRTLRTVVASFRRMAGLLRLKAGGQDVEARLQRAGRALHAASLRLKAPRCGAESSAPGRRGSRVSITQHVFDEHGHPRLIAGGEGAVSWAICPDGPASCRFTATGVTFAPGPQPAGTMFAVRSVSGRRTSVDLSEPWQGRVSWILAPRLHGRPVVGSLVTPVNGTWSGGWAGDYDELRVQACPTIEAVNCVTLSARTAVSAPAPYPSAIVPAGYAGWYLFAFARRTPEDVLFTGVGHPTPADAPPWAAGQATAVSPPVGPITPQ